MLDFIKNKFRSLTKNKKTVVSFCLVFVLFSLLAWLGTDAVWAQSNDNNTATGEKTAGIIAVIISTIAGWLINTFGAIFSSILNVVVAVANYNDFSNAQAIVLGWVVVRDICNMFFILILLVIAFAVILRIDGYDVKKMIPKLLIMAVLINFSRTICGLIIDAAQVVMLTFIHSIKGMGGHLVDMFGIKDYQTFSKDSKGNPNSGQIVVASVLAIIFMLIATVVVIALLGVLVMRIIMLWIYVTLSPLAFFLASFPQGKKYSQKWWSEFSENVIVGPVLAFFLWLSFATLGSVTDGSKLLGPDVDLSAGSPSGLTGILSGSNVMKFAISIGMLLGGLMISSSMAGAAGSFAGKAMGKIQAGAGFMKRNTVDRATGALKTGAAMAGGAVLAGGKKVTLGTLGTIDKLAGRGIEGAVRRARPGSTFSGEGGASGIVMAGLRNTGRFINRNTMGRVFKATQDENKALHNHYVNRRANPNARLRMNNLEWEQQADGTFHEWDTVSNSVNHGNVLHGAGGRPLRAMSDIRAAAHEGFSGVDGRARSAAAKAKEDKVASLQKDHSDVGSGELLQTMNNAGKSNFERAAAAATLADRGEFRNRQDVVTARQVSSFVPGVLKKINDDVDKKQTEFGYDMGNQADVNLFNRRVEKGNIDPSKMSSGAYNSQNGGFLSALRNTLSAEEFENVITSAFRKGGAGLRRNINAGLLASRDHYRQQAALSPAGSQQRAQAEATARAMSVQRIELSGNIQQSIADQSSPTGYDLNALQDFFRNSSAANVNRLSVADLQQFLGSHLNAPSDVAASMNYSKLRAMERQGGNNALVARIRDLMIQMRPANDPDVVAIQGNDDIMRAA